MTQTRLAILGVGGSIGRQALEVVAAHPDRLRVTRSGGRGDDLVRLATASDVELVLVATPGIAGLRPTLAALQAGKSVALANKEVLVVAGHLVAEITGGASERMRPVDSEHSGLWQCLIGEDPADVRRVALTASGGAFRDRAPAELGSVTPEEALRHPTWKMGPKVTIDSATLVNKGYEVIEAHWLYGIPYERIDVVLHPESVIHSLVEFADGSVKAQLAEPDMRLPIQYALLGVRTPSAAPRFDWLRARALHLGPVDAARYPCLAVVLDAARSGDSAAMVGLSAADEVAVAAFLQGELRFDRIADVLRKGIELAVAATPSGPMDLAAIEALDRMVRNALVPVGSVR